MATTSDFVTQLYQNVYGRAPTALELNQGIGQIDLGGVSPNTYAATLLTSAAGANASAIIRTYIAAFGRYPDIAGLQVQENAVTNGGLTLTQLAANFAGSAEFAAKFPSGTDATAYITALYTNVLGRAPDAAGLAVQVAAYNALPGTTAQKQAQFLLNFAQSAEFQTTRNGEVNAVLAYIAVDASVPTVAQAQQASVLPLATTVSLLNDGTNGNGITNNGGTGGTPNFTQTLNFTTAVDSLAGSDSSDLFRGFLSTTTTDNTFSAVDSVDGKGGIDRLSLTLSANAGSAITAVDLSGVKNVEQVYFRDPTSSTITIDASKGTGVTEIWSDTNTGGTLNVTNVASTQTVGLLGTGAATVTATIAGTGTALNVAVNGTSTGSTLTANTAATLNVTATGTASTLTTLNDSALTTLNIKGDQALTIGTALSGAGTTTNLTVDGSAATGALNLKFTDGAGNGGTNQVINVKGGAGNDVIDVGAGLTAADTLDGGAGTDTLALTVGAGAFNFTGFKVTNFETLRVGTGVSGGSALASVDTSALPTGFTKVQIAASANGTSEVQTFKVTAPATSTTTITVDGATVNVTNGDSVTTIAANIAAAQAAIIAADSNVQSVTASGDTVTVTYKASAGDVANLAVSAGTSGSTYSAVTEATKGIASNTTGGVTLQNLALGSSVDIVGSVGGTATLGFKPSDLSATDRLLTVNLGTGSAGVAVNVLDITNATGLTLNDTTGASSIASLTDGAGTDTVKSLTITGTKNLSIASNDLKAITSVDASGHTAGTFSFAVNAANTASVTFKGGAGADTYTAGVKGDIITAGGGADTINLNAAAVQDKVIFTAVSDSTTTAADTIANFSATNDILQFNGLLKGTFALTSGTAAVTSTTFTANGSTQAYYKTDTGVLTLDIDGNGVADMQINLTGAPALTGSNFVFA